MHAAWIEHIIGEYLDFEFCVKSRSVDIDREAISRGQINSPVVISGWV